MLIASIVGDKGFLFQDEAKLAISSHFMHKDNDLTGSVYGDFLGKKSRGFEKKEAEKCGAPCRRELLFLTWNSLKNQLFLGNSQLFSNCPVMANNRSTYGTCNNKSKSLLKSE